MSPSKTHHKINIFKELLHSRCEWHRFLPPRRLWSPGYLGCLLGASWVPPGCLLGLHIMPYWVHIMPYWVPYHAILGIISCHIGYHIMAYWLPYHAILVPNPEIFEIVVTSRFWVPNPEMFEIVVTSRFWVPNPDPMGILLGPTNEL